MGLSKEDLTELIPKILGRKDQEAFELFYNEYSQIINLHANKWLYAVKKASLNIYDFEDLANEIWEHIYIKLPFYDVEKSSMTTFLYMVCSQAAERIVTHYNRQMRNPGEELASLDYELRDEEDYTLMDFLIDPSESIDNQIISEITLHEYLYFLKDFLKSLNGKYQIVYLHMVKGFSLQKSGDIIGVTRERVRQMRNKITDKVMKSQSSLYKINPTEADQFAIKIMSHKSDDEVSEELSIELGTVKICREILKAADIYYTRRW